jgi:hypothetical protein
MSLFQRCANSRADGNADANPYAEVIEDWTERRANRRTETDANSHPVALPVFTFVFGHVKLLSFCMPLTSIQPPAHCQSAVLQNCLVLFRSSYFDF